MGFLAHAHHHRANTKFARKSHSKWTCKQQKPRASAGTQFYNWFIDLRGGTLLKEKRESQLATSKLLHQTPNWICFFEYLPNMNLVGFAQLDLGAPNSQLCFCWCQWNVQGLAETTRPESPALQWDPSCHQQSPSWRGASWRPWPKRWPLSNARILKKHPSRASRGHMDGPTLQSASPTRSLSWSRRPHISEDRHWVFFLQFLTFFGACFCWRQGWEALNHPLVLA